jgi:hypothetical protein
MAIAIIPFQSSWAWNVIGEVIGASDVTIAIGWVWVVAVSLRTTGIA